MVLLLTPTQRRRRGEGEDCEAGALLVCLHLMSALKKGRFSAFVFG